jgi:hypothetical protein
MNTVQCSAALCRRAETQHASVLFTDNCTGKCHGGVDANDALPFRLMAIYIVIESLDHSLSAITVGMLRCMQML